VSARLLERACELDLFPIEELDDLSLILVLLTCPTSSPVYQAALARYRPPASGNLRTWAALREALPPRLRDLLLLGYYGEAHQRVFINQLVELLYTPALVFFTTRWRLVETPVAWAATRLAFQRALRT